MPSLTHAKVCRGSQTHHAVIPSRGDGEGSLTDYRITHNIICVLQSPESFLFVQDNNAIV
jgi:hypothetical protein